ncbi:MAG: hypothetical protein WA185_12570 [Candidatus Acidiferrales bacterium]
MLDLAGYKSVRAIAKTLHRSQAAVRCRLILQGKSSRAHREGFARSALAKELHLSASTIRRFIVKGLLEVRDPRITRGSLDRVRRSGRLQMKGENAVEETAQVTPVQLELAMSATRGSVTQGSSLCSSIPGKSLRAKRAWAEVARSLNAATEAVENLVARGILKLYDPRITEKSLGIFCRRHGALINSQFLDSETRDWLESTMNFAPRTDETAALLLRPLRRHADIVRRCTKCGRTIRGNAFFRHSQKCNPSESECCA